MAAGQPQVAYDGFRIHPPFRIPFQGAVRPEYGVPRIGKAPAAGTELLKEAPVAQGKGAFERQPRRLYLLLIAGKDAS